MLVLDYPTIAARQFENAKGLEIPNNHLFKVFAVVGLRWVAVYFVRKKLNRVYSKLSELLIENRGINIELHEKIENIDDANIKSLISRLESMLEKYTGLENSFQELADKGINNEFPEVEKGQAVIFETIETIYNSLRLLKRYSKKLPRETSELAFESNRRSLNSLKRIINGR